MVPLPIDPFVPEIAARLREHRAVVVTAAPGAGKTTRIPPALVEDGPVICLQPRRVAARSIARRIAEERGWTLGREVGWHVRFERRFSPDTRLLLATEGILTARLQQDPLLSAFRTIVIDEFHERSIHADVAIALARQAWLARDDLRIVVMSATMETVPVSAFLDGCPVVEVPGDTHPLELVYWPDAPIHAAVREALRSHPGHVLCFLPGAGEIRRAIPSVQAATAGQVQVVELHGSLDPAAQDAAIVPTDGRRVILATNIAETSLTVPGVTAVVDTGLHKVARYNPDRAIDSLETERISRDSADQRAGRAARTGPGVACRLWREQDRLRPHREPDIHRIDLSGPLLDVMAWGGHPATFEWFETPSEAAIGAGLDLLRRLGAIGTDGLTPMGHEMHKAPLHPRLARIMIAGQGAREAALACALLSERNYIFPRSTTTTSDLLSAIEHERELPPHVVHLAGELQRLSGIRATGPIDETAFRRALLAGYPDRVAKRRAADSSRVLLASGHGAALTPESGVREATFLVAHDVHAGRRGEGSEARIRVATAVDAEWLTPDSIRVEHAFDRQAGVVRAYSRGYYGAIVLSEQVVPPDPLAAAEILAAEYLRRPLSSEDEQFVRRLRFAGLASDVGPLVAAAAHGKRALQDITLADAVPWNVRQELVRLAPTRLAVPSGRSHTLEYGEDGTVSLSVRLQELFGLAETPRLGPHGQPVVLHVLAPNGRPVQTTMDLRSFWENTYPAVRKELRGRYPRHSWPEDPWTATPTATTKKRADGV